jgi:hypothetical protein
MRGSLGHQRSEQFRHRAPIATNHHDVVTAVTNVLGTAVKLSTAVHLALLDDIQRHDIAVRPELPANVPMGCAAALDAARTRARPLKATGTRRIAVTVSPEA